MINEEKLEKSTQEASDIWLDSLQSDEALPDPEFSEDYQKKMSKLLQGQQNKRKYHLWRYVAVAAVTLIISVVGTYSYPYAAIATGTEELTEQMQNLDLQIQSLNLQLQENGEMLEVLTQQLEDIVVAIASLESEEDASEEVLSDLKTQQEAVEESIASQEEMLKTINETIESLQEQLDVLEEE